MTNESQDSASSFRLLPLLWNATFRPRFSKEKGYSEFNTMHTSEP